MNKKTSLAISGVFSLGVLAASCVCAADAASDIHNNSVNALTRKLDEFHLESTRADAPSVPVDVESPIVKIVMSSTDIMSNDTATVSVDATDNNKVKSTLLYLDGKELERYRGSFILPTLSEGEHTLTASAFDEAGNEGTDTLTFNVTLYVPEPEVPEYIQNANLKWLEFDEESGRWFYTVQEGDWLYKIQSRINVSVEIMDLYNDNIYDPNLIFAGNRIWVTAENEADSDRWAAGITFMDGHDREEITIYENVPVEESDAE